MAAKRRSSTVSANLPIQNGFAVLRSASDWWEMMFASATTIGFRLGGMQKNLADSRRPDTAEFTRMITEKNIAWWQAGLAVLEWQGAMAKLYGQLAAQEMTHLAPTALGPAGVAPQYAALPNRLMALSLRGFADVMKPYHAKSTANARRLSRKGVRR